MRKMLSFVPKLSRQENEEKEKIEGQRRTQILVAKNLVQPQMDFILGVFEFVGQFENDIDGCRGMTKAEREKLRELECEISFLFGNMLGTISSLQEGKTGHLKGDYATDLFRRGAELRGKLSKAIDGLAERGKNG